MDRMKAFEYFKRTGRIFLICHSVLDPDDNESGNVKNVTVSVQQFDDFGRAEFEYCRISELANRGQIECAVNYANLTTAKRCLYPYGETILD